MRNDVKKVLQKPTAKPTARDALWPLIQSMPLGDRGAPILKELAWVLSGKLNPETHEFILPGYCYNIFDKLDLTIFQAFPKFGETVFCPDPSKLAGVKTYAEAKQFFDMDWYRFGKLIGILRRMVRFFELEIEDQIKEDGMWELESSREKDVVAIIGSQWLEQKGVPLANLPAGNLVPTLIHAFTTTAPDEDFQQIWSQVAFQWGPEAMSEFSLGIADGLKGFMDETGQLVGETTRSENYFFFLILWPEIKAMLEESPLPTRPEVFERLRPLNEVGYICLPTIDNFNDFCESIDLKFAGRPPKKS